VTNANIPDISVPVDKQLIFFSGRNGSEITPGQWGVIALIGGGTRAALYLSTSRSAEVYSIVILLIGHKLSSLNVYP